MTFLWREALALLVVLPVLIGTYLLLLGRRKKEAFRYPSVRLVREAIASAQRARPHVPPLLFLLALGVLVVAIARPVTIVTLPTEQRTIVLALDVSWSMAATDVAPNRLAAAQTAARNFVRGLPTDARVGVLAFSGNADLVQPPTTERLDAITAIDRLTLQNGTAIGSALIAALLTLFPTADIAGGYDIWGLGRTPEGPPSLSLDAPRKKTQLVHFNAVPPGSCTWAAIILLTDGRRTVGPEPAHAARLAADFGVRVFTVGFGTPARAQDSLESDALNLALDEPGLKEIAAITHGQYFRAGNAERLRQIYQGLIGRVALERTRIEITALFTAVATVLMLASAGLSLLWCHRVA